MSTITSLRIQGQDNVLVYRTRVTTYMAGIRNILKLSFPLVTRALSYIYRTCPAQTAIYTAGRFTHHLVTSLTTSLHRACMHARCKYT